MYRLWIVAGVVLFALIWNFFIKGIIVLVLVLVMAVPSGRGGSSVSSERRCEKHRIGEPDRGHGSSAVWRGIRNLERLKLGKYILE